MIRSYHALASALVLVLVSAASAQQLAPVAGAPIQTVAPAPAIMLGAPAANVLRAGTPIALKMSQGLTTEGKKLRVGQRFQLEVTEPVTVDGQIVIPVGSPATGEVTDVRNKGMWGKSGRIGAQVLYVRANGRQIRLTGQLDDKGVTGTAGVVGAIAFVPIAGFLVTGTSARIPLGAPVKGFIDEDIPVTFAQGASPASMVVTPATAVPALPVAPATPAATSVSKSQ